jgi:hypothetical protein
MTYLDVSCTLHLDLTGVFLGLVQHLHQDGLLLIYYKLLGQRYFQRYCISQVI